MSDYPPPCTSLSLSIIPFATPQSPDSSMHPLPRLRSAVRRQHKHLRPAAAGGTDHAFAGAEFSHGAGGEVGAEDDEAADEALGRVGFFDAGENRPLAQVAGIQRELHKFVGFFDRLSREHL